MAIIGDNLLNPDTGWQRFDDKNPNFIYNGTFSDGTGNEGTYNLSHHAIQPNDFTSNIEFYFYGTKLRIVGQVLNNRSKIVNITIDDVHETYSNYVDDISGNAINCILQYEKLNLEKKIHKVVIQNDPSQVDTYVVFDAIDIDDDGCMLYRSNDGGLFYDVTPIMTSDTTPSPYTVSATDAASAYPAYKAFDGRSDTFWKTTGSIGGTLYFNFGTNRKVNAFSIFISIDNLSSNEKNIGFGYKYEDSFYIGDSDYNITDWESGEIKLFRLDYTNNEKEYTIEIRNKDTTSGAINEVRFLLDVDTPFYLIKDNTNGKKYNYDEVNKTLIEVDDISILNKNALENTCIYDLSIINTSLLDNLSDDLTILCNKDYNVIVNGLKINKELVLAKHSFSTKLAKNIDFFELVSSISGNSSIKIAVSNDEGVTWKTWDGTAFIDLINTCPLKEYSNLTPDELVQWNTFKDEVYLNGINSTNLKNIDFNPIKTDSMMFAYVLNNQSYSKACKMNKLQYQFDAEGNYFTLKDSEVDIKQNVEKISIIPKKDMDLMKVNIGSSGEINIYNGNTDDIEESTDEDINNILGGEW